MAAVRQRHASMTSPASTAAYTAWFACEPECGWTFA
jgi:hypothetical protein